MNTFNKSTLEPLIKKTCWRTSRSIGSIIILDFGNKVSKTNVKTGKDYEMGEWEIIVSSSNWILLQNNKIITTGESDKTSMDENIIQLQNLKIIALEINKNAKSKFVFENDFVLEIEHKTEKDICYIYMPDELVTTIGYKNQITISSVHSKY